MADGVPDPRGLEWKDAWPLSTPTLSPAPLTDAGADPKLADAITAAVREAADHGDHVTPDKFKAGLVELDARLTWGFAGAMLAQTGVILATVVGAAVAVLRMLG